MNVILLHQQRWRKGVTVVHTVSVHQNQTEHILVVLYELMKCYTHRTAQSCDQTQAYLFVSCRLDSPEYARAPDLLSTRCTRRLRVCTSVATSLDAIEDTTQMRMDESLLQLAIPYS